MITEETVINCFIMLDADAPLMLLFFFTASHFLMSSEQEILDMYFHWLIVEGSSGLPGENYNA